MTTRRCARRVLDVEASGIRKLFDAGGADAINLGIGQPDFDTPAHIKEAAVRSIREGKTGYTANAGIIELRDAICEKLQRENNLSYTPEQIIVTAGGSEALHLVMQALVETGDRVLFADPGFVAYPTLAAIAGGRPEGVALNGTLHIDVEAAKEQMDGARIFILNTPANPTGAVESEESIRALVEYADDRGVTVVSDEVYEHFTYEKEHCSAARYGEDVITINAASKTYAMTGWRVGFLAGPTEYVDQCMKVHQVLPGLCRVRLPVCRPRRVHRRPDAGRGNAGRVPRPPGSPLRGADRYRARLPAPRGGVLYVRPDGANAYTAGDREGSGHRPGRSLRQKCGRLRPIQLCNLAGESPAGGRETRKTHGVNKKW